MPIAYATFANMKERFEEADLIQCANVDAIADAEPYALQKLAKAGAVVDGYVAAHYGDRTGLPVPTLLTEIACDIAMYEMYRREPPQKVKDDRDSAIAVLKDIARGLIKIDDGVPGAQPARPGAVVVPDRDRLFSRDTLGGF